MNWKRYIIISGVVLVGCGISKSQYIDYKAQVPVVTPAPDCPDGLTAYKANIASAVDATCSGSSCHAVRKLGTGNLVKGSDAGNRTTLLSYADSDGSVLFKKIAGADHGGGDQSKALPLDKIKAWRTVEAACPK